MKGFALVFAPSTFSRARKEKRRQTPFPQKKNGASPCRAPLLPAQPPPPRPKGPFQAPGQPRALSQEERSRPPAPSAHTNNNTSCFPFLPPPPHLPKMPEDDAAREAEERAIEMFKIKKLITSLQKAKG